MMVYKIPWEIEYQGYICRKETIRIPDKNKALFEKLCRRRLKQTNLQASSVFLSRYIKFYFTFMLHQKDGALQKYSLHGLSQIDVFDNTALPEDAHLVMVVYICICSHLSLMENSQQSGNCENRQIQLQQDKPFKSKCSFGGTGKDCIGIQ